MQNNKITTVLYSYNLGNFNSALLLFSVCGIFFNRYVELCIISFCIAMLYINKVLMIKKNFLIIFSLLFFYSSATVLINKYNYFRFIQQIFLLSIFFYCYHQIIIQHGYKTVFNNYLKLAYYVSLLGVIQFFVFLFTGKNIFFIISRRPCYPVVVGSHILRISSILEEPSYLSAVITPAVYYYLWNHDRKNDKKRFFVLISVFICTFSTVSYVVFFGMFLYYLSRKYKILRIIIFLGMFILFFSLLMGHNRRLEINVSKKNVFSDIIMKVDDTVESFSDMRPQSFELLNLSTYAWTSNLWVALNAPSRLFGTGLGTHGESYHKVYKSSFQYYGLNAYDAFSMGIRLFSEFGILGAILFLSLFLINFNKKNIVNQATFFYILTAILRGGNYFLYGVVFFITLYILSGRLKI